MAPASGTDPAPLLAPADWSLFPGDSLPFFLIALGLSLTVAVGEVAGAFRTKPLSVKAIFHQWALPYYGLYLLFTYLVARILLEYQVITPGWGSAVAVGLLGPTLLKTQVKLFKPLSGSEGLTANLEQILTGVQQFCFDRISIDLGHRRIDQKLAVARMDEGQLEKLVEAIFGDSQYQATYKPMIEERREQAPESVRALLIALIEKENPSLLERLEDEPPG